MNGIRPGARVRLSSSLLSTTPLPASASARGKPIAIFGDGSQLQDYIYATDLVDAFLAVGLSAAPPGEMSSCGFGRSVPFREMVETIVRVLGKGFIEFVPWPPDYERVETGDLSVDISKLRRLTGWEPSIPLEEGIRRMYQDIEPRLAQYL